MNFNQSQIDRIIEMAWEDRTPFEAIEFQFGIKENDVRKIMRSSLKESSFKMWRKRVKGRKTKHHYHYHFFLSGNAQITQIDSSRWASPYPKMIGLIGR